MTGVEGQSVRLPCTYGGEVTSMCWGQGACPLTHCGSDIIWTNGYSVTFQKDKRYKLNGNIGEGDVSLTIENATQADSGLYCCRVEKRGWFNDIKITLDLSIKPGELVFLLPLITSCGFPEIRVFCLILTVFLY